MVNVYKIKVYAALILSPLITVLSFFIVLQFYGFVWALLGMVGGILISVLISKLLISNPFSKMLEGQGILTFNLDSTGVIRPFVVGVESPYIKNNREGVDDVFDRNAVYQFAVPLQNRKNIELLQDGGVRLTLDKTQIVNVLKKESYGVIELNANEYRIFDKKKTGFIKKVLPFLNKDKDKIQLQLTYEALRKVEAASKDNITVITLSEQQYNAGRFAFWHYPCLIWNDQIKSIITKDFLSGQEKEAFAEHGVLYLNRKMEELTSAIREFGRYVVELLKPKGGLLGSKWVWIIIVIVIIILLAMFAPSIITAVKGASGGGGGAVESIKSTLGQGTITPVSP